MEEGGGTSSLPQAHISFNKGRIKRLEKVVVKGSCGPRAFKPSNNHLSLSLVVFFIIRQIFLRDFHSALFSAVVGTKKSVRKRLRLAEKKKKKKIDGSTQAFVNRHQ